MKSLLQKGLTPEFPLNLFVNEGPLFMTHHWHEQTELLYVIDGILKVGVNNTIFNLNKNDLLIIGSGDTHFFSSKENYSKRAIIHFKPSIFETFSNDELKHSSIKEYTLPTIKLSSEINLKVYSAVIENIKVLIDEFYQKKPCYKIALKARIFDITISLIRNFSTQNSHTPSPSYHIEKLHSIEKAFSYIENNYHHKIYLKDIAYFMGYSPFHFSRMFTAKTGMNFSNYLTNYRITISEWLLLTEKYSVSEIAFKSGFNSINAFNKAFKKIKELSPSEFIKLQ